MSTTRRSSTKLLVGGTLIMLMLAAVATWTLMRFTLGPQTYNGIALSPQEQLPPPTGLVDGWLNSNPPSAWAVRGDTAVTGTYGKFSYDRGTGVVSVDVPSDWGTINVSTGEPLELVIGTGRIKNVTAYLAPVKEPTPRDTSFPVTSVTQQGGLTVVNIDPMPQLDDQVLMLVAEFDTKRGSDYAKYRWRVNP